MRRDSHARNRGKSISGSGKNKDNEDTEKQGVFEKVFLQLNEQGRVGGGEVGGRSGQITTGPFGCAGRHHRRGGITTLGGAGWGKTDGSLSGVGMTGLSC